jgi:micrococcal nuclease
MRKVLLFLVGLFIWSCSSQKEIKKDISNQFSSLNQIELMKSYNGEASGEKRWYICNISSVYDGDTYTGFIEVGFDILTKKKLRLQKINTPEIRGEEREEGLVVRDYVRELILGKDVMVVTTWPETYGKYGRLIVEVVIGEIILSEHLIEKGFGEFVIYVEDLEE